MHMQGYQIRAERTVGGRLAIALPWFVPTTTGSAVQTGAVVFAQMGPYVVVRPSMRRGSEKA